MSNTTQILFNSPALHSLKRDQLVKLCKIHSIKATGKNTELIEKLKLHALTLPRDAPLSVATRSENPFPLNSDDISELGGSSQPPCERSRPSGQWEVVMDNVEKIDSTRGSLNSSKATGKDKLIGEFGTTSGSMTSVSSSLRALASSLGFKRTGTSENSTNSKQGLESKLSTNTTASEATREPAQTTVPSSQLPSEILTPLPDSLGAGGYTHASDTDVDMEAPVPGQALRPGVPAPPDARLSLGLHLTEPQTPSKGSQPTTTIRLISGRESCDVQKVASPTPSTPQLIPFKTTFELVMSPRLASGIGFGTLNSAVAWSSENADIYPTLPTDTGEHPKSPDMDRQLTSNVDADGDVSMPCAFSAPLIDAASDAKMALPSETAFGSKAPRPFVFGSPLPGHRVSDVQFREAAANVLDEMNRRLQAEGVNPVDLGIIKRFHPGGDGVTMAQTGPASENQTGEIKKMFEKMHQAEFDKMEGIDALVKRKAVSSTKIDNNTPKNDVISKKRKSNVLIEEPRREPTQPLCRASSTRVISNGRRGKLSKAEGSDQVVDADEERGKKRPKTDENSADVHATNLEAQKKKEKEREAVRRKLEINKAKRKSSAAAGRQNGRVSIGKTPQKQKSRFGFFAQAKSFVQSVFGRSKPATTGTSTVMAPTASSKAKVGKLQEAGDVTKKSQKNVTTTKRLTTEPVVGTNGNIGSGTPFRGGTNNDREKNQATTSMGSRSPPNSMEFQVEPTPGTIIGGNTPTFSHISSMGRRGLVTEGKTSTTGAQGSLTNRSIASNLSSKTSERERIPSSSRLHAPTASSLAKMNSRVAATPGTAEPSGDNKYASRIPVVRKPNTLTSITNNLLHDTTTKLASPEKVSKLSPTPFSPDNKIATENETEVVTTLQRQRTLSGRKPRISRSKVISRLASQRANAVKSGMNTPRAKATSRPPLSVGRTRSSLGTRANKPTGRSSHSGLRVAGGGNDLLMSAKKRARQTEYYARRRSRAEATKSMKA